MSNHCMRTVTAPEVVAMTDLRFRWQAGLTLRFVVGWLLACAVTLLIVWGVWA